MNYSRLLVMVIFLCCAVLVCCQAQAQHAIVSAGENITGSGGSASYTLGQVAFQTFSGSGVSEAQGVQQPYEISVVTASSDLKKIDLNIATYPNPVTDILTLSVDGINSSAFSYQLFNLAGEIIDQKLISNRISKINMSAYSPSTYLLQIVKDKQEIKTYKIIKK